MGKHKRKYLLTGLGGIIIGLSLMMVFNSFWISSSSNDSCMSCHAHPESDASYRLSYHYNNGSGTKTDCAACHLPPKGTFRHAYTKARMGIKDMWSHLTKDAESIDWDRKSELEYAHRIVFNESCKECHITLFPEGITDEGTTAHLYYEDNEKKLDLKCISCHLDAGHYNPDYKHGSLKETFRPSGEIYESAAEVTAFENFIETVPGTAASISMIAVPGGEFTMGSPEDEPFRNTDEGPQRRIRISPFFMGEVEVTWDQFWSFYSETMSEGRTPPSVIYENNSRKDIDAVSGPTPPFGIPDQGWGMGSRPAITMTHYSAQTFCQWLSLKTGRKYRLPTEAEWEYAARGKEGNPFPWTQKESKSEDGCFFANFKPDRGNYTKDGNLITSKVGTYDAKSNGLYDMAGNVAEWTSTVYTESGVLSMGDINPNIEYNAAKEDPYAMKKKSVRGGSWKDPETFIRSAWRTYEYQNETRSYIGFRCVRTQVSNSNKKQKR